MGKKGVKEWRRGVATQEASSAIRGEDQTRDSVRVWGSGG